MQIIKDSYIDSFEKNIERVSIRTRNYIKHPNDDNIHDLRTSIRRFDASYRVLPKKIRTKKKIQTFAKSYKDFFKVNSSIRDLDIIISKIPNDSNDGEMDGILQKLNQKREKRLKNALKNAKSLLKLKKPNISKEKISEKKTQSIFERITMKLIDNIEKNLPIVISDINQVAKLHELRKDCKKLRYYLELVGDDTIPLLLKLKQIQTMLGDIHDNDITIDYLAKLKNNNLKQIIENERMKRRQNYEKFISIISKQKSL